MEPTELNLFFSPPERLRLTVGADRSYPTVKPVWAAPLSQPGNHLALLDGAGGEIVTIADPSRLPPASREAVEVELRRRYLTATVSRVLEAHVEFGATYWRVETDRGDREFVTQNLQENAVWLSERHLLLLDVDGNRFEVPDTAALDGPSRRLLAAVV